MTREDTDAKPTVEGRKGESFFTPSIKVYFQEKLPGETANEAEADIELILWQDLGVGSVITKSASRKGTVLLGEDPDELFQEVERARRVFEDKVSPEGYTYFLQTYKLMKIGKDDLTPKDKKRIEEIRPYLEQALRANKMREESLLKVGYLESAFRQVIPPRSY